MYLVKDNTMKMTPQRVAVLDFLDGNETHPSAEDIYSSVKKMHPSMSLATVYNTLEIMKREGMLQELSIDTERKRYDPNIRHHHHIICRSCSKVADIHDQFDLTVPEENNCGFSIRSSHIEFYGLCPECQKREGGE